MDAQELLGIAKEAALTAGKFLLDNSKAVKKVNKEEGRDIKLKADFDSEQIVIDFLTKRSDFSILSEEKGLIEGNNAGLTWIIDPLDGSLNYMRGIPLACVSIGLWKIEEPVLGVIYDFNRLELFSVIVGQKAWLNDKKIKTSCVIKKNGAVLCTGFPVNTSFNPRVLTSFTKKVREYKKVRLLGSAALSLAYVASGKVDAYMENDIMIWDIAAGLAIASGAGGKYSITNGRKLNSLNVIVSNGHFCTE